MEGCGQRPDVKNMPQFLDQASADVRENEVSRHFAISLYAELAQVHKQAIIPYIPRMMASIVRSLSFSTDTQQLHQACAKAVASVSRYTVDPSSSYDSNQKILSNLCSPLIPVLASELRSSVVGAAVCLQALVESEKWKFVHPDLQGCICSQATAALEERGVHSVALLHLVKSLAKYSKDASQLNVAKWIRIGLQILQEDLGMSGSWQQRVAAAQLIGVILTMAEPNKLGLDLCATTEILETFLTDKVNVVQIAVAEALETLKATTLEKLVHCQLPDTSCQGNKRNSVTEESGLSGTLSPKSVASSHEAVPSMASSRDKFGMGPQSSQQWMKDSLCLSSHASLGHPAPSKLKGNTPATMPRWVLSEIPASSKLFCNSEVLPRSCPSKPVRRSSVDLQRKVSNYLMQEKVLIGSRTSIQYKRNQIHDDGGKASLPSREHAEGCQDCSDMNCTHVFSKEEDESKNRLACTDHRCGKFDSELLREHDGGVEEIISRLPSNCRSGCVNDDCAHAVLSSGCTDDVFSQKDTREDILNERLTATDMGGHLKMEQPRALTEEFTFRSPSSLLQSLQSSRPAKQRGKSFKKCTDSDIHLFKESNWNESDIVTSCESEESGVVVRGSESANVMSGASSCSTSKDLNSSGSRTFESGSCMNGQRPLISNEDGKCLSSLQSSDCETQVSREECVTLRDGFDSGVEKPRSRQISKLHSSSKEPKWNGSDIVTSCDSEESQVVALGSESTNVTLGASSCSTSRDLNSSGSRTFESGSCMNGQRPLISDEDGKCLSSLRSSDCETQVSREECVTLRDGFDSGVEKLRRRQIGKLHRSSKKGSPQRDSSEQLGSCNISSASRPGSKRRGVVDQWSEGLACSEGFKRQICAGTLLGFASAFAVLLVTALVIHCLNQAYDSSSLVPT